MTTEVASTLSAAQVAATVQPQANAIANASTASVSSDAFVFFAAFDGTDNGPDPQTDGSGDSQTTAVFQLYQQVLGQSPNVVASYYAGPGTPGTLPGSDGSSIWNVLAQAVSAAQDAYDNFALTATNWLKSNPGGSLSSMIVSFSRGGASAAIFAQMLYENGLVNAQGVMLIPPGQVGAVSAALIIDPVLTEDYSPLPTTLSNYFVNHNMDFPNTVNNLAVVQAQDETRVLFDGADYADPGARIFAVTGNHGDAGDLYDSGLGGIYLQAYTDFLRRAGLTIGAVPGPRQYQAGTSVNIHKEVSPPWYDGPTNAPGARQTVPAGTPVTAVGNATVFTAYNGDIVVGGKGYTTTSINVTLVLLPNSNASVSESGDVITVNNGATLTLSGIPQGDNGVMSFDGTILLTQDSDVIINSPSAFGGTIDGFVAGDTVDLAGIGIATGATLGLNNVLTVQESDGGILTIQFDPRQNFNGGQFVVTDDGNGGTDITIGGSTVLYGPTGTTGGGIVASGFIVNDTGISKATAAGIETTVAAHTATYSGSATAFDSATSTLYLEEQQSNGGMDVVSFDATNGNFSDHGAVPNVFATFVYENATNSLFGLGGVSGGGITTNGFVVSASGFYAYDLTAAKETLAVADSATFIANAFAVDGSSGLVYVEQIETNGVHLVSVNPSTHVVNDVALLAHPLQNFVYDPTTHELFGVLASGGGIGSNGPFISADGFYRVDPTTGNETLVQSNTSSFVLADYAMGANDRMYLEELSGGSPHLVAVSTVTGGVTDEGVLASSFTSFVGAQTGLAAPPPRPPTLAGATLAVNGGTVTTIIKAGQPVGIDPLIAEFGGTITTLVLQGPGTATIAGPAMIDTLDVTSGAGLVLQGSAVSTDPVTIDAGGNVSGYGTITGAETMNGTITAAGGTLDLTGNVSGTGVLTFNTGSSLQLEGTVAATNSLVFTGIGESLILGASADVLAPVSGFGTTDSIALEDQPVSSAVYDVATHVLAVTGSSGVVFDLSLLGTYQQSNFSVSNGDVGWTVGTPSPTPSIAALAATTVGMGQASPVGGISVAETPTSAGETFTMVLTDTNGVLSATAGGGGTITPSNGGTTLTISGTLLQLNADLATLSDDDAATGADTITLNAHDSNGGQATTASIAVTVNGAPVIAVSTPVTVQQSQATAVRGVTIAETGNTTTSGEVFTAVLTAASGVLSAIPSAIGGGGTITPSNGGAMLTISGTLAQLNADLTTLTDDEAATAEDTITVNVRDSFGNTATPKGIAVTINGLPPPLKPTIRPVAPGTVEKTQTTVIGVITPGAAGDTLTLTETAGAGILNLGTVQTDGTQQIIYSAPSSVPATTTDAVGYTVIENGATAAAAAHVQLDAGPSITAETPSTIGQGQTTDIGIVTPGLAGDTLTLTKTTGAGTLTLGAVRADGTQPVIYTAPASVPADTTDTVSYTISDQHSDAIASCGPRTIKLTAATPPPATVLTPESGGSLEDAAGNIWTVTANGNVDENGVPVPGGGGTAAFTIVNNIDYGLDSGGSGWYTYATTTKLWTTAAAPPIGTTPPIATPATVLTPESGGSLEDAAGNIWTVTANGNVDENGVPVPGGGGTAAFTIVNNIDYGLDAGGSGWYTYATTTKLWTSAAAPPIGTTSTPTPATELTPESGGSLEDAAGNTWTLTANGGVDENGAPVPGGGGTAEFTIVNNIDYGLDAGGSGWYTYAATTELWTSVAVPPSISEGIQAAPFAPDAAIDPSTTISQNDVSAVVPVGDRMVFVGGSGDTIILSGGTSTITDTGGNNTYVVPAAGEGFEAFTSNVFDLGDTLDLRAALSATTWNGSSSALSQYLTVTIATQGATLSIVAIPGGPVSSLASIAGVNAATLATVLAHALT